MRVGNFISKMQRQIHCGRTEKKKRTDHGELVFNFQVPIYINCLVMMIKLMMIYQRNSSLSAFFLDRTFKQQSSRRDTQDAADENQDICLAHDDFLPEH